MSVTMTSRQKEILDAVLTVIDRDGMKKFTMKNVAQEIGVTDAALYKHFPDKAAILGALATLFRESTLDILAGIAIDPNLDSLAKLEQFVKGRARQFQDNRAMTVTLFSEELFRGTEAVSVLDHDTMASHGQLLMKIINEGQVAGTLRKDLPPQHLVLLLTGPMRLMVSTWKSAPQEGPALVDRVGAFWTTVAKRVRA